MRILRSLCVLIWSREFGKWALENVKLYNKNGMMILVTYDVDTTTPEGARRLRRVAKECTNYGHRVQNSVFECVLLNAQYVSLRAKIESIMDKHTDSVRFYFLGNNWEQHIVSIGRETSLNMETPLIL